MSALPPRPRGPFTSLEDLAQFIEALPEDSPDIPVGFDMETTHRWPLVTDHPCGTAMCIGGWAAWINRHGANPLEGVIKSLKPSLTLDQAHSLCYPPPGSPGWNATPREAAQAIRNLDRDGDPRWPEGDV